MRPHVVTWLGHLLPDGVAAAIAPGWFACVGLAGLAGLLVMLRLARRGGVEGGVIATAVLWCYVAAVLAGIIVPMAIDATEWLLRTGHLRLRWSGMTSFWGYLAGFAAVALVCRRHAVPLARLGDLAAVPMGIALVFARAGCFLGGCDYGQVTRVPWAVRFPPASPAWRDHLQAGLLPPDRPASLPVHPTQLYEALVGVVIVGVALVIARRRWARAREGRVFLAAAATYALGRIVVEAFRGDLGRGVYGGLSSGQIFSIAVSIAIAIAVGLHRRRVVAVAATGMLALVLLAPRAAHAQAPVAGPMPQPQPAPPLAPPGAAQPADPYARPLVRYAPPTAGAAPAPPTPARTAPRTGAPPLHLDLALFGAFATPIDRRADQVSALGGASFSAGLLRERLGAWLDLDSLGNRDASHGTLLVAVGALGRVNDKLAIGGRVGLGATLVNFDEPVFRDVSGAAFRIEALAEYTLTERWRIHVRPLSFDVLSAAELGGRITTWQVRAGLAYQIDLRGGR